MVSPEFLPDLRERAFSKQPGRNELKGIDEPGDGKLGRIADEQVHVIVFPVKFLELCTHLGAYLLAGHFYVLAHAVRDCLSAVFGHKD